MAPMLLKEMKGGAAKFSCASPATTAVCTSIDRRSIVQPRARALDAAARRSTGRTSTLGAAAGGQSKGRSGGARRRSLDAAAPAAVAIADLVISPPGSARYLLNGGDAPAAPPGDVLQPPPAAAAARPKGSGTEVVAVSRAASPPQQPENQVVVLRVSLHCKGCAGKLKKHLSKMEGVTSFDIDLVTKKVTVVGDVTPLGVLNSISKVKNAQFWPSSVLLPPPPPGLATYEATRG